MLDHHLQRAIIHKLAFTPSASFSELKPDDVDNKLFTYHLKKTTSSGYVQKSEDGQYSLTPDGRRLSTGVLDKQQALVTERPLSALFLVIRRKSDGAWLLYTRKTHPMLGYKGFMHVRPNAAEDIAMTARNQVREKTGLVGSFTALGGGYVRIFKRDELESFTHFTLLYCNDAEGELVQNDAHSEFYWDINPDFEQGTMFPTTITLKKAYDRGEPFFVEKTFTI
jgi:hypothetical protein